MRTSEHAKQERRIVFFPSSDSLAVHALARVKFSNTDAEEQKQKGKDSSGQTR